MFSFMQIYVWIHTYLDQFSMFRLHSKHTLFHPHASLYYQCANECKVANSSELYFYLVCVPVEDPCFFFLQLIPPRGCAYVCFDERQSAARALDGLKGYTLSGSSLKAS